MGSNPARCSRKNSSKTANSIRFSLFKKNAGNAFHTPPSSKLSGILLSNTVSESYSPKRTERTRRRFTAATLHNDSSFEPSDIHRTYKNSKTTEAV